MIPPDTQPDPRHAIAVAFRDRARQEELAGNYFLGAVWRQAADIAEGFVERPGPVPGSGPASRFGTVPGSGTLCGAPSTTAWVR